MTDALHSLFGQGHVDATRTRECVAMPGKREQSIFTPQDIADRLVLFWGDYPAMDPAWCPGQLVRAYEYPADGLVAHWPRRTFCNPPYGELQLWLEHGGDFEDVIWLVPIRCHRVWWREWWHKLDVKIALDPVKFVGFKQPFPAPMLLGYRGGPASAMRFEEMFGDLGGVL